MARSFNDFQHAILILHDPPSEQRPLFSPASAKEGVRGFLNTMLDDLDDPHVGTFAERLKSAKATGELPLDFEAELVAEIIGAYVQGLFRSVLLTYDRPQIERQVDRFLTRLAV